MHEQYKFIGPHRDIGVQDGGEAYHNFKQEQRRLAVAPGEVAKTPEQLAAIEGIRNATIAVGAELGVDLRGRLPTDSEIHFFPDRAAYSAALKANLGEKYDTTIGSGANAHPNIGIVMVLRDSPLANMSALAHEFGHYADRKMVLPILQPNGYTTPL